MPGTSNRVGLAGTLVLALLLTGSSPSQSPAQTAVSLMTSPGDSAAITDLSQLSRALAAQERFYGSVRLTVVVCASTRPELGVIIAQDDTGLELLELGHQSHQFAPGERIRIQGDRLLLRRRELGVQISAAPLVDNDGLHGYRTQTNEITLKAGRVPIELDWFNGFRAFALEVFQNDANGRPQRIADSALWHSRRTGTPGDTNLPGLWVECFEGYWEQVPDFDLLQPARSGTATNFDLRMRTQDETVGLRFTGFFEAPYDGRYTFSVSSDDGSLFFVGASQVTVTILGNTNPPTLRPGLIGQELDNLGDHVWTSVAGRASFVTRRAGGLELELRSGAERLSVVIVDAAGLNPTALLNTYVRAVGVGRTALSGSRRVVLDRLYVASGSDLQCAGAEPEPAGLALRLMDIEQVQAMQLPEAKRELPVRIRGVVTAVNRSDRWVSLQDDTRGIFVDLQAFSNSYPARAELLEVTGHTAPGNFAPVVVAEQIKRLGPGRMPEPAHPAWNELANGSMDVQWVEFQGLVSGVHSNVLDLLLPDGPLQVRMENHFASELSRYDHAVVRIRGTLFAIWNADTRQVQFGSLLMRDGSVNVDTAPPPDPFAAPLKSTRDLLLFDARATAFRPVKVNAQVLYSDPQTIFAVDNGMGLRLRAAQSPELHPGDLIEAVGNAEIGGPSPVLRQALVRKTGAAPLPKPALLAGPDLARKGLDSTLVTVEAKLMAMHSEQRSPVLELQSSGQLFVARVKAGADQPLSLRIGSLLRVAGVYAEAGHNPRPGSRPEPFELLINSSADIRVLSQPSWWTLERLGAVVGLLLVVLVLAAAWITQLRRQVEQRTDQLQREIREREHAEHHRALEAERSRIARDLHDDLGSSLTEIGVLASTGQHGNATGSGSDLFDAIAGKARGSIAALDVIVWAVDPEDNSLQSLADYLSGFAGEYLSHSNIACRFRVPVSVPEIMLEGRIRHDLFLAVKETLNNVVRHAQASEVEFGIVVTDSGLEIVIADNGKGFDTTLASEGNGLKNLRGRLAKLGGSFIVESGQGSGTTVRIRLALPLPEPPLVGTNGHE